MEAAKNELKKDLEVSLKKLGKFTPEQIAAIIALIMEILPIFMKV